MQSGPGEHLVVITDARQVAGAEAAVGQLLAHLDGDLLVTVASVDAKVGRFIAGHRDGAEVLELPSLASKADLGKAWSVYTKLRDLEPTVVHLNKAEVGGLRYIEVLLQLLGSMRVISLVHHVEEPGSRVSGILARWLARRSDAIVAVGVSLARQLEAILGLAPGRVTAIHNALTPVEPASGSQIRGRNATFTACALTRMVPHKRVSDIVAAVAEIEDLRLILAGDGHDSDALKTQAQAMGVGDRVEFPGWVSASSVLERSDVYVLASEIEGFPMALLEAQTASLPIVASDVGGVGEIVEHGVTGFLFPVGDVHELAGCLRKLRDDRELWWAMARAAHDTAANRPGPQDMAKAYAELYWPGADND